MGSSTARKALHRTTGIAADGSDPRHSEESDMNTRLENQRLLVVGGGSGIAQQIAVDALDAGAQVVLAGRSTGRLAPIAAALSEGRRSNDVTTVRIDLADEASIVAAAETLGELDHIVSVAADHANGPIGDLTEGAIENAFRAKVIGPLLLAKHLAPRVRAGGSMVLFAGVAGWKPAAGLAVMATTNGAVAVLAEALAVELAPIRVNAISPGIVDSGAWDTLGDNKQQLFDDTAAGNPVGRVGQPSDISAATLSLLTNGFITGATLHVDGGGRLV